MMFLVFSFQINITMRIFPECGGLRKSSDHVTSLTEKLNQQRKAGHEDYCDITLICSGTRFPVHKAILSASSPYFECLLEGHFAERTQNEIDLTESISDPETLECILEFIYTGGLLVEGSDFRELLGASSLLLLNNAIELLSEYLKNSLVIANCIDIFELAFKYSLENICGFCLSIMQAHMHDYFCHGTKMFAVSPELFVHLCNHNVFFHTSNQNKTNLVREYIENLKAIGTEVSQGIVRELYQIAEFHDIPEMHSLFKDLLEDDIEILAKQTHVSSEHLDNDNSETQNAEMLLVRSKEKKDDANLIGWLSKPGKWIKLASINLASLGCASLWALGKFLGFAHESMAFENGPNVTIIPFHSGQPRRVASGCGNSCADIDDKPCPHLSFTAWNELFCLYPETEFRSNSECHEWPFISYSDSEDTVGEAYVIVGYTIAKLSVDNNQWEKVYDLSFPDDYWDEDEFERDSCLVSDVRLQVSINEEHVFLMADSWFKNCVTVMELTQDVTGKLSCKEIFHSDEISYPRHSSHILVGATPKKLTFQKFYCLSNWKSAIGRITTVSLRTKKIKKTKLKVDNFRFPENESAFRTWNSEMPQYAISKQSGLLHFVGSVMPYAGVSLFQAFQAFWSSTGPFLRSVQI